ncbi:MAG: TIR domain-containing protein [Pyrinomonadaceae bacterium]
MPVAPTPPGPVEVFISYSHKDEKLREELDKHLTILNRAGEINAWHDRKLSAGEVFAEEIDQRLNMAQVILLLVSPDFLASDYCFGVEMEQAMQRHEDAEAIVIPIILRPSNWKMMPFGKLQALPRDGRPVITWTHKDQAFLDIEEGIKQAVKKFKYPKQQLAENILLGTKPETDLKKTSYRRFCNKCGSSIGDDEQFCKECGSEGGAEKAVPKRSENQVLKTKDETGEITKIEIYIRRQAGSVTDIQIRLLLLEEFGVNAEKLHISILPGSVKVVIEGDSKVLSRIVEEYRNSAALRRKLAHSTGLKSITYIEGGEEYTLDTAPFDPRDFPLFNDSSISPIKILREAIRAVPAVKYALGVAGMAAAVAIVAGFSIDYKVAIFGTIIMSGLMFGLVLFSSFARQGAASLKPLALALAWTFVLLISATSFCIFTGFFFSWPRPLEVYVGGSPSPPPGPTIHITHVPSYDPVGGPDSHVDIAGEVLGTSSNKDFSVVIYARTDSTWYVQPTVGEAFTQIGSDGKWGSTIHGGTDYAALLVKRQTFKVKPTTSTLPGMSDDVLSVATEPGSR